MSFISQVTPIIDQFSMKGQDCLQLVGSTFYLFGVTWPGSDITTPKIQVLKSVDDGVTWTHVVYGPAVKFFLDGPTNLAHDGIACVPNGTKIRVFFCSAAGSSSETGLTGLLSQNQFNTVTDLFEGSSISDFNPFSYTYNNVSTYAEESVQFPQICVRSTTSGYRVIFPSERNTVTLIGAWATTIFDGSSFSGVKTRISESGNDPSFLMNGLVDPTTDSFTVFFLDESSVPFQGVLNLDGTIDRLQDFGFNDFATLAKFAYINDGKMYVNWSQRPTSADFASLLSGTSNSDPISLAQENVTSGLPAGNTYIQNPQTAIFNNASTCFCSFYFAKKVGATQMHLLKSFKAGSFWFDYSIEAIFSDATVSYDTGADIFNYAGVFHDSTKFSMVAGGNLLQALFGPPGPAPFPVYFARGDISFHSSCVTVVNLLVQVSDALVFADHVTVPVSSTPGSGTEVHNCPDVIISSAYCSSVKTAVDDEAQLHNCDEEVFSETAQPCLEMD